MAAANQPTSRSGSNLQSIPLYSQSSQFRNWRYSEVELNEIRRDLNIGAVNRVRKNVEEERAQQSIIPTSTPSDPSTPIPSISNTPSRSASPTPTPEISEIQYLTVEDEISLVTYYLTKITQISQAFEFDEMVQATAMTYLKRFYLRNTCMDYHPKNVMLTCLFLATKTENHQISIDRFSGKMKTTPNDILSLEFLVSQSLKFEYKIHHAHLAAYGLSLDLETTDLPLELIHSTTISAQSFISRSRLTSLEFIYTPSQIALACFRLVSPLVVDTWLGVKDPKKTGGEEMMELKRLVNVLEEIGNVIEGTKDGGPDIEVVREVDKRLKFAQNPEKVEGSALYKKRKAEEELEKEVKAHAKAAKRPISNDESVFN